MAFDRGSAAAWYRKNRARSRTLFDLIAPEAYYEQPIALRHPIVFYEGHLPAFSFNTLVKRALGRPSIDARLETLFARGIDPHESTAAVADARGAAALWPARDEVHRFAEEADRQVLEAVEHAELERPGDPLLDRAEAVFTILEHEAMHQETLLYMWHRLPLADKRAPAGYRPRVEGVSPQQQSVEVPAGCATLGVSRDAVPFGWDNEHPALSTQVPAFAIDRHDVTNEQFLEFAEAGGYRAREGWRAEDFEWIELEKIAHPLFWERHDARWHWRAMFETVPLPGAWPVYVSQAEASAYARWRGARLATEAEFQRAAYGSAARQPPPPTGEAPAGATRRAFDFAC